LTPPPTSADESSRREGLFSAIRQKRSKPIIWWRSYLPRLQNGSAWLRLLRLPNLLTVPGDVLAGFLLAPAAAGGAGSIRCLLAIPAGLLLYAAGLVLNDLFDYAEDLRDRPDRPLPSQRSRAKPPPPPR
jgi:4-hydroxybenzoate polyprenyltransferase